MRCNHDRLIYGPDFATKCAECFIPASEIHTGRQWFKEVVIFGQGTCYGAAIASEPQYIKDAVENDSGVVVGLRAWFRLSLGEHVPIVYNGDRKARARKQR